MYIMYVDESGDPGVVDSPSTDYYLSAIVVHESMWPKFLDDAIAFRQTLKRLKGLQMQAEIHASEFVSRRSQLRGNIGRNDRLDILKKCIQWLATKPYLSVITVRVNKTRHSDPFSIAWKALIQRFNNTLSFQNFPNPAFKYDFGIIVADNTDGKKLTQLLRKMRRVNFIPSMYPESAARNLPLKFVIKDPVFRESSESYLIQFVDVVAYFARQYFTPNKYIRQKAGQFYYRNLNPIINQKAVKSASHNRIVHL